jgi:hypothetical protein
MAGKPRNKLGNAEKSRKSRKRRKTPMPVNGRLYYRLQAFFAVKNCKVPSCFGFVSSKMVKSIIE